MREARFLQRAAIRLSHYFEFRGCQLDNTGFKTGSGSQYSVVGSSCGTEIGIQLSASSLTSSPFQA